ncbi:MAG: bifunctional riboflavin kinase/FAD synthetase [Planctomycetota bacterium]|jgi:riboflavin kinase/FMN adenylyltransferase|nr:bifunctional riboflavin kinase/FAD synthetase [Planctomycetota bacterium]
MAPPRIAAIGKFDALHRGHRALMAAAAVRGEPVLIGFSGMAEVLGWEQRLPIMAPADRGRVLTDWGDTMRTVEGVEMPFSLVRDLEPEAFLDLLAERLSIAGVVTGADFRFGRDRRGDVALLAQLCAERGWYHEVVPAVRHGTEVVSSTLVRGALAQGDVALVRSLLGRPHRLQAEVVRGDGRGHRIGFPTANCAGFRNQPPGAGVYACRAHVDGAGPYAAAVNIGYLPTIGDRRPLTVEAHLLDFHQDCYGADISLDFLLQLRGERRFPGLDALVEQLGRDVAATRAAVPIG